MIEGACIVGAEIYKIEVRSPDGVGPVPQWTPMDMRYQGETPPVPPDPGPTPLPPNWIDLQHVSVLGSSPRILSFPANAKWNRLALPGDALVIDITTNQHWPPVAIDENHPSQSATLWIFEFIGGVWYATGAERLRPEQITGTAKPEDMPLSRLVAEGWLYDPNRWGVMAGYNPQPNEVVGFMVVAGSTRSDDTTPVEERTPIVFFPWPSNAGADPVNVQWVV